MECYGKLGTFFGGERTRPMLEFTAQGHELDATGSPGLYLHLMKRCLTNSIYGDSEFTPVSSSGFLRRRVSRWLFARGLYLVRRSYDQRTREEGRDRPPSAHTMIGIQRLNNLQCCIEDVLAHDVPGDLIETGVWRGGAAIFMRAALKAYGGRNRITWVADSFQGLPKPNPKLYPRDWGDRHWKRRELAIPLEEVKANFARYGLLDNQVRFLAGWFRDTLPNARIESLAILRIDADMYESTIDVLRSLYTKLSPGGYVIVDDYYNPSLGGCRQAVDDFRSERGIAEELKKIDWTGAFWRRAR